VIKFITEYKHCNVKVFFIVEERIAYVVNWDTKENNFSYLCPCCMLKRNRKEIMRMVNSNKKYFAGQVRWCSINLENELQYFGNKLSNFKYLEGEQFIAGDPRDISLKTRWLVRDKVAKLFKEEVKKIQQSLNRNKTCLD